MAASAPGSTSITSRTTSSDGSANWPGAGRMEAAPRVDRTRPADPWCGANLYTNVTNDRPAPMPAARLQAAIESAWENRDSLNTGTTGIVRESVEETLDLLDAGTLRVAEKIDGNWQVHQWLKKAVLLSFRLNDMAPIGGGPRDGKRGESFWFDKVASKFA